MKSRKQMIGKRRQRSPSYLILLLQHVERILADQALALGEIDRKRVGVADLAVLAQHVERKLHPAHRRLQRQVGVEHAREAKLLELLVRQLGRAAAEHYVDDLRPRQLTDGGDLLWRLRRLDECHVCAGFAVAMRALDRSVE